MTEETKDRASRAATPPWDPKPARGPIRGVISGYRFYNPDLGRWINRDPIGEHQFYLHYSSKLRLQDRERLVNAAREPAYLFCGNNDIINIDKDGCLVGYIAAAAMVRCGLPYFIAGHLKYQNDQDSLKHCWVSCMIARDCGAIASAVAGLTKEARDNIFLLFSKDKREKIKDMLDDLAADKQGIDCAGWETRSLVPGMPGFGWIGRWFRESCDCCCRREIK